MVFFSTWPMETLPAMWTHVASVLGPFQRDLLVCKTLSGWNLKFCSMSLRVLPKWWYVACRGICSSLRRFGLHSACSILFRTQEILWESRCCRRVNHLLPELGPGLLSLQHACDLQVLFHEQSQPLPSLWRWMMSQWHFTQIWDRPAFWQVS